MLTTTMRRRGESWVRDLFATFNIDYLANETAAELRLPDAVLEEEGVENTALWSLSPRDRVQWLTGRLWHCTSIMPSMLCESLELTQGSTYAQGARKLREQLLAAV